MMIRTDEIERLSEQIMNAFHPERIILFGSYAYGSPTPDSDVDLLVITPHQGKGSRKSAEIVCQVRPTFPVDLLVRSSEQVEQRLALNDFFFREILERGKVLYAASDG